MQQYGNNTERNKSFVCSLMKIKTGTQDIETQPNSKSRKHSVHPFTLTRRPPDNMLPLLIVLATATTSFALPLRKNTPPTTRFENPKATNLIIHRDFLHRLDHDPHTNLVSFIERDTRGFFKKKEKEKDPGSKDDLSTKAGQSFSQKEIEKLSTEVENSRAEVTKAMDAHAALETKLEKAMQAGGKLTPVQTHQWHGKAYSYTPKQDRWLTLPYWNGYACAIGVVVGPSGHCHRSLSRTVGTCSANPDKKILAELGMYRSETCECSMCNGFSGDVYAVPFCHTRGLNVCHCMLVDNEILSEDKCTELLR